MCSNGPKPSKFAPTDEVITVFSGHALCGGVTSFTSARKKLIDGILGSLSNRFETERLLKATSIANLSLGPKNLKDEPGL